MSQVDVAKAAFHQGEAMEEDAEDGQKEGKKDDSDDGEDDEETTDCRDVGHNIYILAHQVTLAQLHTCNWQLVTSV